jgi:phosphate transport system substrate-binding protein
MLAPRISGTAISLIGLLLLGTSCSRNQTAQTLEFPQALGQAENVNYKEAGSQLSGEVKVDGSSTVFPISQIMAAEFQKANPGVKVSVKVSGTGGGFKKFCQGETDITDASRPINSAEMQQCQQNKVEYVELPIAFDGISVVVNQQNNSVECLKVDELKRMWEPKAQGKVTSWNQIRSNLPNQPLQLFGPDKESGTYDYFTQAIVGEEGKSRGDYTASKDDNALVQGVATNPNAVGFFSYAYYLRNQNRLKLVAVDSGYGCVKPSSQSIADSSYQPLSRPVFIYVKKSANRRDVQAFTNFYLTPENANFLLQVGYVPLPNITLRAANYRFNQGRTGTVFGGRGSVIGVGRSEL